MEELQDLLAHLKNQGLTDVKIPIDVWCGIIEYFANKQKNKPELYTLLGNIK